MRWLGYPPLPERPFRPTPVTFPFDPAPFYGSVMTYRGSDSIIPGRTKIDDYNASLGFRTRGHCGVPYDQLKDSLVCPWTLDFHVDYDTSVFESRFLRTSYLPFLNQIGRIPGMAASLKTSFGPFAFVGEVNAAIQDARFIDGLGIARNMMPMTWQASIAYQFDWNPWIQEIGAQGDFISVGYSGSKDMAGVSILQNGIPTRIGFVPQHRLFLTGDTGDRRAGRFHLGGIFRQPRHGGCVDPAKRHTNPDRIRPATPAFPHRRRVGDGRAEGGRGILGQLGLSGERRRDGQSRAWLVRIDPAQFLIRLRPALGERTKILEASSRQMDGADRFSPAPHRNEQED